MRLKLDDIDFWSYLKKVWRFREFFYFLALRDIRARYKQTFFGILWIVVPSLILALIFWLVFDVFLNLYQGPIPYILLVFSKLAFWNFFTQGISISTTSITNNYNLLIKSAFPRELLVFSAVVVRIIDFLFTFMVLILIILLYKADFSSTVLWLVPILMTEILLVVGLGLLLSSLNVYLRDVSLSMPLIMTVWLFITPIIYSLDSVPQEFRVFLILNPMTGIVEGVRNSLLLNRTPDLNLLLFSIAISSVIFVAGFVIFKHLERNFADVI